MGEENREQSSVGKEKKKKQKKDGKKKCGSFVYFILTCFADLRRFIDIYQRIGLLNLERVFICFQDRPNLEEKTLAATKAEPVQIPQEQAVVLS